MFHSEVLKMFRECGINATFASGLNLFDTSFTYYVGRFMVSEVFREPSQTVIRLRYKVSDDYNSEPKVIDGLAGLKRFLNDECPTTVSIDYRWIDSMGQVSVDVSLERGFNVVNLNGRYGVDSPVWVSTMDMQKIGDEGEADILRECSDWDDLCGCFQKVAGDFYPKGINGRLVSVITVDDAIVENVLPMLDAILESGISEILKSKVMKVIPGVYCSEEV